MDKFNAVLVSLLSKYSAVELGLPQIQPQSDMGTHFFFSCFSYFLLTR